MATIKIKQTKKQNWGSQISEKNVGCIGFDQNEPCGGT